MPRAPHSEMPSDFDYSTPEAQSALMGLTEIVLEFRDELNTAFAPDEEVEGDATVFQPHRIVMRDTESERRVALYERTLGLIVIPVLIRRAVILSSRRIARALRGGDR